jgi:hypothetical protein
MNVGDLVWVKTNVAGKQLAILMEPLDWASEGITIWKVQRLDLLELYGNGCTSICYPHELEKVNESR